MRVQARLVSVAALSVIAAVNMSFADWPMFGGNPQRTGWADNEKLLNKSNIDTLHG